MIIPHDKARKMLFITFLIISTFAMAGFTAADGPGDHVVALDQSSLIKLIGFGILALLGEIWRNQRVLFKITNAHAESLKEIKGYCEGKNDSCGTSSRK